MDKTTGKELIEWAENLHYVDWVEIGTKIKQNKKKLTRDQIKELRRIEKHLYHREEYAGEMM